MSGGPKPARRMHRHFRPSKFTSEIRAGPKRALTITLTLTLTLTLTYNSVHSLFVFRASQRSPFRGFGGLTSVASNKEITTPRVHAALGLQPGSLHAVASWLACEFVARATCVEIPCDGLLLCIDNHPCTLLVAVLIAMDPTVLSALLRAEGNPGK